MGTVYIFPAAPQVRCHLPAQQSPVPDRDTSAQQDLSHPNRIEPRFARTPQIYWAFVVRATMFRDNPVGRLNCRHDHALVGPVRLSPRKRKGPMKQQTNVLQVTVTIIVGVVVLGGLFGAIWTPGVVLTGIAALVGLFVILFRGAQAMNEPDNFGEGLTAVLAALILLPAAIAASFVLGVTVGVADAFSDGFSTGNSSYTECLLDYDTSLEECEELQ